jgi:hypothetical protein
MKRYLNMALVGLISINTPAIAAITIGTDTTDWTAADRIDASAAMGVAGYELSGRYENGAYKFLLKSVPQTGTTSIPAKAIGANTTIWLNTDQSTTTGYKIWGWAGGEEFSINVASDKTLDLYKYTTVNGVTTEVFVKKLATSDYAFMIDAATGSQALEFQIAESNFTATNVAAPSTAGIKLYADVNNSDFLPKPYSNGEYTVSRTALPTAVKNGKRIGIVYSATSANRFWALKSYSQLVMSAQVQAMQAGIPFDLLSEDDLLDLTKIIKYDTLVFPYFANVETSKLAKTEENLTLAATKYAIGMVAAGNFMTNDQAGNALPGDSYIRMKNLLGITRVNGAGPVAVTVNASNAAHPLLQGGYTANEQVLTYAAAYTDYFDTASIAGFTVTPVLNQVLNSTDVKNAVLTSITTNGARNIHFGAIQFMQDANLLWPALQWSAYGGKAPAALKLGRETSLFAARNDMDESMYPDEIDTVEIPLLGEPVAAKTNPATPAKPAQLITAWKNAYNFVGSYYLNIDNKPSDPTTGTNWTVSKPLYKKYLALGNEIGTHSYSHPIDTNALNATQIQHEFADSKTQIQTNLGITNLGGAVPGAPDAMPAAIEMLKHVSYLSGGYSGVGAGFPNAMGYLTPADTKVYLSPNMTFDFTNIEFLKKTPAETEVIWANEFDTLNKHASQAIIHWPWHDYAPTIGTALNYGGTRSDGSSINYTVDMFSNLIKKAFEAGTEFVTGADLSNRITSFHNSALAVTQTDASTLNLKLTASDAGRFAIATSAPIASVDNWYAYNTEKVFPAKTGGTYNVRLGSTPTAVTHITKLPMRANLLYARLNSTNSKKLEFSFEGSGEVKVALKCNTGTRTISGANSSTFDSTSNVLTLKFTALKTQVASVTTTCP